MHKTSKIDFFSVDIPSSSDLEIILKDLHSLAADSEKRNEEINDDWIRLARGNVSGDGYLGDMMRISMAPAGFRANLAGEIVPVNLNKDEGMAACAACYYDFESSILVLQRNSKAVTSSQLSRYFQQIADLDGEVEIVPISRPIDIMKMKSLPVIRKIHIVSAVVDAMTTMEDIDDHTRQLILAAAQAESPAIELVMKSARAKQATLNPAVAAQTVESWLKIHGYLSDEEHEVVKKIVVTGKSETGTTAEFDLLKDRMFTPMSYEWVPDDEALWKTRSEKIQQAWDLNKADLKRTLAARATEQD